MPLEPIIIGIIVAIAFGVFRQRQKKKETGATKIIIVNDGDNVEVETGSGSTGGEESQFKRILTFVVSAAAGFAAAGAIIVFLIEPAMGAVDPDSPIAIVLYVVMTWLIYTMIRNYNRN